MKAVCCQDTWLHKFLVHIMPSLSDDVGHWIVKFDTTIMNCSDVVKTLNVNRSTALAVVKECPDISMLKWWITWSSQKCHIIWWHIPSKTCSSAFPIIVECLCYMYDAERPSNIQLSLLSQRVQPHGSEIPHTTYSSWSALPVNFCCCDFKLRHEPHYLKPIQFGWLYTWKSDPEPATPDTNVWGLLRTRPLHLQGTNPCGWCVCSLIWPPTVSPYVRHHEITTVVFGSFVLGK